MHFCWLRRGDKGYRLYDPQKKKICFSRDVSFNENECGFEREVTQAGGDQYVQLDLQGEDDSSPEPVITHQSPVLSPQEQPNVPQQQPSVPQEQPNVPQQQPSVPQEQPNVRRSGRERHFPNYYGDRIYLSAV